MEMFELVASSFHNLVNTAEKFVIFPKQTFWPTHTKNPEVHTLKDDFYGICIISNFFWRIHYHIFTNLSTKFLFCVYLSKILKS